LGFGELNIFLFIKMKEILITSIGQSNPSDFNISLPYCSEIKLLEANIPVSFNNVPAGSFTIIGTISGSHTITFAAGRYSQSTFATAATELINTATGQTYTVTVGSANNFVFSSTETFAISGDTLGAYIGFTTTSTASSHTGYSTFSNFFPSHMFIRIDKVFGIDNGTICNTSNVFHAVPLCCSGVTVYGSNDSAPWVKLINLFGSVATITATVTLQLSNGLAVDMNGDNWSMKIYARL